MKAVDFVAISPQLLHHSVEIPPEVANLIVSLGKRDRDVQIALPYLLNLFLQFDHRPLYYECQDEDEHRADSHGSASGNHQHLVPLWIL
jgi:hypothetical protein